jgi:dihydroflavonol-4-reductase
MKETLKTRPLVAVTGSTGHVGSVLIPMLIRQGYTAKGLYRKGRPLPESENVIWIKGDLRKEAHIEELLTGCSVLIHCASVISVGEDNKEEVYQVNVEATRNLVQSCLEKGIRLIYISSSTATFPEPTNLVLDENAPLVDTPEFYYGWTKAQAERLIRAAVLKQGLDAVILRPTALVGPPDRQPSRFGRVIFDLHDGRLPMISSSGYDLLDIRDFCRTVINSIELGMTGEVYLTGGEFYSMKKLAALACPSRIPTVIPLNLLIALLPLIHLYDRFFPLQWPINRESLLTLKRAPKKVDSSKAVRHLKHEVRPLEQSVSDLIEWRGRRETNTNQT